MKVTPGRLFGRVECALAGLALIVLAAACSPRSPAPPAGVLRLSQRNEPADLDPARATLPDEFFILRALSEGLVTPDPDGGPPQPGAAASWSISSDGLAYTFHLRPGSRWSNGEPVTAQDFVDSYRRVLTPATAAPKAALFFPVAGAAEYYRGEIEDFGGTGFSASDDLTLIIRLKHPMPHFLAYAASGPWLPVNPRAVLRHGRDWTRPGHFIGNGAFTLEEWRPGRRIVLRRRDDYWAAAQVRLDEIHFLAFDDGDAEERAFRAGQVDVTMAVPVHRLPAYAGLQPPVLVSQPLHETRFLSFNTQRGPLADPRVRRALSLALDRDALVNHVVLGGQRPARNFLPSGLGGYDPRLPPPPADPIAEAQRLLAAAGFPGGVGFPRLTLVTWTNLPLVEAIQAMWKRDLGIEVELSRHEARVHLAALARGDYDLALMTSIPDVADPAAVLGEFRTGDPGNHPQWSDPAFDAALDAIRDATNPAEQAARLAEAEQILLHAAPIAPLYFNSRNFLVHPRIRGWREDRLWNRFYRNVEAGEN